MRCFVCPRVGCMVLAILFRVHAAKTGKQAIDPVVHVPISTQLLPTMQAPSSQTPIAQSALPVVDAFPAPQPHETRLVNITGVIQFYMMDIIDVHADVSAKPRRDHKAFGVLVSENDGRVTLRIDPRRTKIKHGDIVKALVRLETTGQSAAGTARTKTAFQMTC